MSYFFSNSFLSSITDFLNGFFGFRDQTSTTSLKSTTALQNVDFNAASTFTKLSADQTQLKLTGMTATAVGGVLSQYQGASVLSKNDLADIAAGRGWLKEIDAYNDTRESIRMDFDAGQKSVSLTLWSAYVEKYVGPEVEKVDYLIKFTDGTTGTGTVSATQTTQPGEIVVNLDASVTGGKFIASVEVAPNLFLATIPAGTQDDPNFHAPVSEFTLKAVSYVANTTVDSGRDLCLTGSVCDDKLIGGKGNDTISGGWGNDTIQAGGGNNYVSGGRGCDTFVFDWASKGDTAISDFTRGQDRLKLDQGIVVTSLAVEGRDTILTLSNGGHIELVGVTGVSDWHAFL